MKAHGAAKSFADKAPRLPWPLIAAAVALTVGLDLWLAWNNYSESVARSVELTRATRLSRIAECIIHLDEVLTMSARMAAATGDKAWIDRYREFESELDQLIKEAKVLAPTTEGLEDASATDKANGILVRMEKASFELVLQGRKEEGLALLTGPEYEHQKRVYAVGMDSFVNEMEAQQHKDSADRQRRLSAFLAGQCTTTVLALALWYLALRRVASVWRREADLHKASAHALQLSQERLRVILTSIGDGVLATDTQRRVIHLNPAAERLTGWVSEEACGRPVEEVLRIIDEQTRAAAEDPIGNVLRTGRVQGLASHILLIARDGTERAIADSAAPIRGDDGAVEGVVLVFRDVTEERWRQQKLEESEKRFRTVFENAADGILIADGEHKRFLSSNPAICRMLGYSPEEILGLGVMEIHLEKDLPDALEQFERLIRKETSLIKDLPIRRKDGSVFYADVCASPLPLEGKECLVGFFRDVTERKRYEQQLAHLASHDPLTGLANRRLFEEEAHRAVLRARRGTPSTLLLFDLDHFKAVNDALGHAAGDDLLVRITGLVQGCLRGEDLLARIGGDEFAVLLEGTPAAEAGAVAERIRQAVHDSACPADGHVHSTLSIGLVKIDGQHGVVSLMAKADAAMYEAKDQGRDRVVCSQAALAK